jgi:glucose dehydrogenase
MAWPCLGLPGILLFACTTLAVGQQVKKIDDKVLKAAQKGTEWLSNGMDWNEQRYSIMTQINPGSIAKLALAWSYDLGAGGGNQQATPLFSNGVLYTVTNWSIVAAIDAKTGKEIWRHDPDADRTIIQPGKSRLCCGVNSRGSRCTKARCSFPSSHGIPPLKRSDGSRLGADNPAAERCRWRQISSSRHWATAA